MEFFSEYDLIQAMSGVDAYGNGKCVVAIRHQRSNGHGVMIDVDEEFITEKPIVQVCKQPGGFIGVDLIFDSIEDRDLKIIFAYLDRYFSSDSSMSDDGLIFSQFTVAILPHAYNGKYWAMGVNPIFRTLVPEDITGEPRIIRLVFLMQENLDAIPNFLFLQSSDEALETLCGDEAEFLQ